MERLPEPELMDDDAQARAYAQADFEAPHEHFVQLFQAAFAGHEVAGTYLDLGCGAADIGVRFARAHPAVRIHGVDGAQAMLDHGRERIERAGLSARITLHRGHLPQATLPQAQYDGVICNSLLHHLREPATLWRSLRRYAKRGAPVFVMDLMRPPSRAQAEALVAQYAADEPPILQRDFLHSLLAAYEPLELRHQLEAAGLDHLFIHVVSDRHFTVHGFMR